MPKISIVIPVYNAEQYLRECLDSVINQTFKDIEIICVNDGSTDNSLSILEEYAQKDKRIKILNKENEGVHTAKNLGIDEAKSDYTIFLDADDFFDLRMFEKLYNKALETGCEIVACEAYNFDNETKKISKHNSLLKDNLPQQKEIFSWKDLKNLNIINPSSWNKIIKTDFLKKTGLRFCNFGLYEDYAFFYSLYAYAVSITYIEDSLVYYRNNIESQRSNLNKDSFQDLCNVVDKVFENCSKLLYYDEIKNSIIACAVDLFLYFVKKQNNYKNAYNKLHNIFNNPLYNDVDMQLLNNNYDYFSEFKKIKKYNYKQLQKKMFWENIFSLKNDTNNHKILKILGIKFKFYKTKMFKHIFNKFLCLKNNDNNKVLNICGIKFRKKSKYLALKNEFISLKNEIKFIQYQKCNNKVSNLVNSLYVFSKINIEPNTILLVEQNIVHSETIPGYVKYFFDMGYKVDVVMPQKLGEEKPFARFKSNDLRIFYLNNDEFSLYLKLDKIKEYSKIFVNSNILYMNMKWQDFYEYFYDIHKCDSKLFVIEHHGELLKKEWVKDNKVFMLAEFPELKDKAPMVNPHYWGKINITSNTIGETNFIIIGNIESQRRNYNLIIEAVQNLINDGITNFKITHIGRKGNLKNIPLKLREYFDFKGYQPFDVLFSELECADYILMLLDPTNIDHKRYISIGTNGAFQYSYGFLKPCIIHKNFAEVHKFNNKNSLLYENNEKLADTMKMAIKMNQKDYIEMQNNLKRTADEIYASSINNLKKAFEKERK
ncbi:MAG: glycosyltransferase family 2 protein [Clostridium sp.]|nr:glycosyltransferase family 2 protein [Clostridium sp.]